MDAGVAELKARAATAFSASDFCAARDLTLAAIGQLKRSQCSSDASPGIARELSRLFSNLSAAHQELCDFAEAAAQAQRSIQLDPSWHRPHLRLCLSLASLHRPADAAAAVRRGLAACQDPTQLRELRDALTALPPQQPADGAAQVPATERGGEGGESVEGEEPHGTGDPAAKRRRRDPDPSPTEPPPLQRPQPPATSTAPPPPPRLPQGPLLAPPVASPLVPPLPVTALCGFLGSGKTTLVRHLLSGLGRGAAARVGLLVNDLAPLNVDAQLIGLQPPMPLPLPMPLPPSGQAPPQQQQEVALQQALGAEQPLGLERLQQLLAVRPPLLTQPLPGQPLAEQQPGLELQLPLLPLLQQQQQQQQQRLPQEAAAEAVAATTAGTQPPQQLQSSHRQHPPQHQPHPQPAPAPFEMVELSNGCVCCNLRGDLQQQLRRLAALRPPLAHVIVECTGVGEPAALAEAVAALAGEGLELRRMVTVVDAGAFLGLMLGGRGGGVETADVVLLNKCDTLLDRAQRRLGATPPPPPPQQQQHEGQQQAQGQPGPGAAALAAAAAAAAEAAEAEAQRELRRVAAAVRVLNPAARVLPCVRCAVPLEAILGAQEAQEADRGVPEAQEALGARGASEAQEGEEGELLEAAAGVGCGRAEGGAVFAPVPPPEGRAAASVSARGNDAGAGSAADGRGVEGGLGGGGGGGAGGAPAGGAHEEEEYGIGSLVFRSRRPFHPGRMWALLQALAAAGAGEAEAAEAAEVEAAEVEAAAAPERAEAAGDPGSNGGSGRPPLVLPLTGGGSGACRLPYPPPPLLRAKGLFWVASLPQ
ncbi:hypothetical protein TSOC_005655, partial [Tetrabaena socialis]